MPVSDPLERFHACDCAEHIESYTHLPWTDAVLAVATCMKRCPYCGHQSASAGKLREHLRGMQYQQRNLAVKMESKGRRGV